MQNHIRDHHAVHLPEHVSCNRHGGKRGYAVNIHVVHDWALHMVLGALQPVSTVDDPHLRKFLDAHVQGLFGKTYLQQEVDASIKDIEQQVRSSLQRYHDEGCKFTLSCDSWKPKQKRNRRHCLAMYLTCCTASGELKTFCIGAPAVAAPRTGERYREAVSHCLHHFGHPRTFCLACRITKGASARLCAPRLREKMKPATRSCCSFWAARRMPCNLRQSTACHRCDAKSRLTATAMTAVGRAPIPLQLRQQLESDSRRRRGSAGVELIRNASPCAISSKARSSASESWSGITSTTKMITTAQKPMLGRRTCPTLHSLGRPVAGRDCAAAPQHAGPRRLQSEASLQGSRAAF